MKPKIVRSIICNTIVSVALQASPLTFQTQDNPKPSFSKIIIVDGVTSIELPSGRTIPLGQGVICSDDCVATETFAPPDDNARRRWILVPFIGTAIVLCAVLCRGGSAPPSVTPNPPSNPPGPNPAPTPGREVPPRTEVPEPVTVMTLGLGLAMMAALARKRA